MQTFLIAKEGGLFIIMLLTTYTVSEMRGITCRFCVLGDSSGRGSSSHSCWLPGLVPHSSTLRYAAECDNPCFYVNAYPINSMGIQKD